METFRGWSYGRHNSKEVICRQSWSIYLCQSSSCHFLSLHYTFISLVLQSSLPPVLSSIFLCCQHVIPLLYSPAAHFLSAFSISPHVFSLSRPILSAGLHLMVSPSFSQIKSWVFSPPLSLREFCSPGGSAVEMDPPPLSLFVVEAAQETILSPHPSPLVGQHSDRHDPPPSRCPVSRFTACYFSRWREKAGQRDGRVDAGNGSREEGREEWFRPGVKKSSVLHFFSCSDTLTSPGGNVWDMTQCPPVHLSGSTETFYLFKESLHDDLTSALGLHS